MDKARNGEKAVKKKFKICVFGGKQWEYERVRNKIITKESWLPILVFSKIVIKMKKKLKKIFQYWKKLYFCNLKTEKKSCLKH